MVRKKSNGWNGLNRDPICGVEQRTGVAEGPNAAMIQSASHRAFGRAAGFQPLSCALLVIIGLIGQPVLAQPFRTQAAPPSSPSREARQSFQTKIDEQARLLAGDPRLGRVPQHKLQDFAEFVVGNVLFVTTHEMGHALLLEMDLPTLSGVEIGCRRFCRSDRARTWRETLLGPDTDRSGQGMVRDRATQDNRQETRLTTMTVTVSTSGAHTGSSA